MTAARRSSEGGLGWIRATTAPAAASRGSQASGEMDEGRGWAAWARARAPASSPGCRPWRRRGSPVQRPELPPPSLPPSLPPSSSGIRRRGATAAERGRKRRRAPGGGDRWRSGRRRRWGAGGYGRIMGLGFQ
ncbi:hypothetical protein DAI22_11g007120 [Oryza sativa Japonica Group]|nr:hypothetical protein DAI22_11g007120 [Oryza sativa Japonica Group]